jgi:hypothetical protein
MRIEELLHDKFDKWQVPKLIPKKYEMSEERIWRKRGRRAQAIAAPVREIRALLRATGRG